MSGTLSDTCDPRAALCSEILATMGPAFGTIVQICSLIFLMNFDKPEELIALSSALRLTVRVDGKEYTAGHLFSDSDLIDWALVRQELDCLGDLISACQKHRFDEIQARLASAIFHQNSAAE